MKNLPMTSSDHSIVTCSGLHAKNKMRKCASYHNPTYYLIRRISDANYNT